MARIIVVSRCILSGVPEDSRVSPSQVSVSPLGPPRIPLLGPFNLPTMHFLSSLGLSIHLSS